MDKSSKKSRNFSRWNPTNTTLEVPGKKIVISDMKKKGTNDLFKAMFTRCTI